MLGHLSLYSLWVLVTRLADGFLWDWGRKRLQIGRFAYERLKDSHTLIKLKISQLNKPWTPKLLK